MNQVTRDIMAYCKCTLEWALKIQERMECDGVDFSEITESEFHTAIIRADSDLLRETHTSPFDTIDLGDIKTNEYTGIRRTGNRA